MTNFLFLDSKITADGDCSHEIKRRLLLGRKVMTNLDSIFKSRDITLSTKVCLVKTIIFPVVMYRCESWAIKKAECRRIDAFELWCWRRLLRVPWTTRRSDLFFFFNYFFVILGRAGSLLLRQLFFGCSELLSRCGAQASYCSCFSFCRAQVLQHAGFSSCSPRA